MALYKMDKVRIYPYVYNNHSEFMCIVGTRNLAHDVSEVGHQSSSENSDVVINCGGSAQCLGTRIHNGDQPFFG